MARRLLSLLVSGVLAASGAVGPLTPTSAVAAQAEAVEGGTFTAQPASGAPAPVAGLAASLYADTTFASPVVTRTDPRIAFVWGSGAPAVGLPTDGFAARWTGRITAPSTGTYTFYVNADDGARLSINGTTRLSRWSAGSLRETSATVTLQAGHAYRIGLDYFDATGSSNVALRWSGPGLAKALVAQQYLTTGTTTPTAAGTQLWSDPATWGGAVPTASGSVTIPAGVEVTLDVSPPGLAYLQIDGTLKFGPTNLVLTSDAIMVHGLLQVGTAASPFTHRARIVLTGADATKDVMGMGTKMIGVMGGTLDLHGATRTSWTKLTATAAKGANTITVANAAGWRVGDRIAIASTDFDFTQAEDRTITEISGAAVSGTALTLDIPLAVTHWGTVQTVDGRPVDERAEVALLTRTVTVEGEALSSAAGFGGQIMVMPGSTGRFSNVELTRMGQLGVLRRYPIHFHMNGDAGANSYVKNSAVHHAFNRCITVHGTNKTTLQSNVCHDTIGHGYFFEDGAETGNTVEGNLGMTIRKPAAGKNLLASDLTPTAFWLTSADNVVRNNVAAGGDGFGIWMALPEHPTGLSTNAAVWNRRTPLGVFSGNVAHSNNRNGLHVDNGPRPDGTTESAPYRPIANPADPKSAPVVATFEGQVAYKNRGDGVWLRGNNHRLVNATLADNAMGVTLASVESFVSDSLIVGETANVGSPKSWETKGLDGRSLPFFWDPAFPIRGFQFYDGRVGVERTTLANFTSNAQRRASGLGWRLDNAFGVHPGNYATGLKFVNAERVYAPTPVVGRDGDNSAVFRDTDGSVTGTANRYVVANAPFLRDGSCSAQATWNAYVCGGSYVTLQAETLDANTAAIKPLTVTRADGVSQTLQGATPTTRYAHTSVRPNARYDVNFNDVDGLVTPARTRYVLVHGAGTWLRFSVDFPTEPKVTKYGCDMDLGPTWCRGKAVSLAALDAATTSSYFYDAATKKVHLKIVAGTTDYEALEVSPR